MTPPDEVTYVLACAVADIPDDEALAVTLNDREIAVARDGDEIFAIENLCSHAHVELSDGEVAGGTIECSLHGSCFDLRTGKPTSFPATEPVATFPVDVRGGDVYVDTQSTLNGVVPQ